MGLTKLIQTATVLAILAVSSGQLPRILRIVQKAQLELIQETKASKWGQLPLLPLRD